MTRFWKTAIPTCAFLGLAATAFAFPDDFQTTVAKAQKTLTELDQAIAKIEARKSGGSTSVMSTRRAIAPEGATRTGRRSIAPETPTRTTTRTPARTRARANRPAANNAQKKPDNTKKNP